MSENPIDISSAQVSSKKSLKKQFSVKSAIKLQEDLEALNRQFATVWYGAAAYVMREEKDKIFLTEKSNFFLMMANRFYEDIEDGEVVTKKLGPKWLSWNGRREYEDIVFRPAYDLPPSIYNRWRGFKYNAMESGSCNLFLEHIHDNIANGNDEVYQFILDWIADMIQRPEKKPGTAIVIRSDKEGTGKGFFARHLGKLFGNHFMSLEKPSQLIGKFNAHLQDKLFLFVDEGSLTEERAADFLKSLITEPTVNIEDKGKPIRDVQSYHRVLIASNHEQVIKAGFHDRRFLVCDLKNKNPKSYFDAIEEQLLGGEVENGGYEALLHFFKHRKYNPDTVSNPPKTSALAAQKLKNLDDEVMWWYDCLFLGYVGEWNWRDTENELETRRLYNAYTEWCDRIKPKKRLSESWLARSLNHKAGAMLMSESRGGNSARYYKMVGLDEARAAFENKLGHKVDWSE